MRQHVSFSCHISYHWALLFVYPSTTIYKTTAHPFGRVQEYKSQISDLVCHLPSQREMWFMFMVKYLKCHLKPKQMALRFQWEGRKERKGELKCNPGTFQQCLCLFTPEVAYLKSNREKNNNLVLLFQVGDSSVELMMTPNFNTYIKHLSYNMLIWHKMWIITMFYIWSENIFYVGKWLGCLASDLYP